MVTKKQHYVPQLLLRSFSSSTKTEDRINVYDIDRRQVRRTQNIKDVCSGNYTYDKDNEVEKLLCNDIEGPAAQEISKICTSPSKAGAIPSDALLRFMLVQLARTRQAYSSNTDFFNGMMKTVFAETARLNGLDVSATERIRIEPTEPRRLLSFMTVYASTQYKLLSDLHLSVLINDTSEQFILSDHPVFQYNWYLRESRHPLANSITVRGIQFFLPLSPRIAICLYDPLVYIYRSNLPNNSISVTLKDVQILNEFQALGANAILMAESDLMMETLVKLGIRFQNKSASTVFATNSVPTDRGDGNLRSTHVAIRKQTQVSSMPSFVKVKNKIRRRLLQCEHRQPEVVLAHEAFTAEMNRVRKENMLGGNSVDSTQTAN